MGSLEQSSKLDRLIVIAAPSCCGKSVFLKHLLRGDLDHVEEDLQLIDPEQWVLLNANQRHALSSETDARVIYHYALPSLELHSGAYGGFQSDDRLDVLNRASNVLFVTLYVELDVLQDRLQRRFRAWRSGVRVLLTSPARYIGEWRRLKRLTSLYAKPAEMASIYERWFEFSTSVEGARNIVIDAQGDYVTRSVAEWRGESASDD